jgi:tetratricopeptide (TPR) repeat protein
MSLVKIATVTIVIALTASATLGQQPTTAPEDVLERAITLNDAEGAEATLAFLEAEQARSDLAPPAKALLGALLLAAERPGEAYVLLDPLSRLDQAPPAVLYNTWRAAALGGFGDERLALLERASAADPISPAARELGLIRGRQGRLQEAYILLAPWARAHPDDIEARLAAAHSALQLNRIPDAEELLSDLPQEIPQVRLLWGKILFHRGDPYGALATLKALGDGSDLSPVLDRDRRQTMANAHIAVGQGAQAVELLQQRAGEDAGLVLVLTRAYSQSGDVAAALETIRPLGQAAIEESSAFGTQLAADLLHEYGRQLNANGAQTEAVTPLELAAGLDPDNEKIFQALGQALAVAGRPEEATAALERFNQLARSAVPATVQQSALERDVEDPTGGQLREALTLLGKDQPAKALEIVRTEQRMVPDDPRIMIVEAQILLFLDLHDEALFAADRAVEMAPEFADGYYQRGVVLMGMQRLEEAEIAYRKALEIASAHTPAMNDLAVLLIFQNRHDEARQLLERVLELDPDDRLAARNLDGLND